MKDIVVVVSLLLAVQAAAAGEAEVVAYLKTGQYKKAEVELRAMAASGDSKAMVTLGELNFNGKLGQADFDRAYDWWLRAFEIGNADGLSNIGVLFRDGKGVQRQPEIAYGIFLIVHMNSLGSQATQTRNNRNLQKITRVLEQEQIMSSLCQSEEQIYRQVRSRGMSGEQAGADEVRLKDKDWWLEDEIPAYECSALN